MRAFLFAVAIAATILPAAAQPVIEGAAVDAIRQKGELACGVSTGASPGMSTLDDRGNWSGFEVDFCRAVSAAVLGDAGKVRFVPLEFRNAFAALRSGAVDMLARSATWTFLRDTELRFDVPGIYLYDGQGFLVRKSLNVASARELDGATICVSSGTTTELNLADWFRANRLRYTPVVSAAREQNIANLESGRCDAYTNERGGLAANRAALPKPDEYVVLPDVISKEPLGPYVRQDDPRFRDIVAWTLHALVAAEEFGVTSANVGEAVKGHPSPEVGRMLGRSGEFGAKLDLPNDWAVKAIAAVGNYGEMFDRNLGEGSRIGLDRGPNRLWSRGGLLYAPPFR